MKNKLLKSTLLISLATPVVAIASSCVPTNVNNSVEATKASGQLNAITKYTVTFQNGPGQSGVTWEGAKVVKAKAGSTFGSIAQPTATYDNRPQSWWVDSATGNKITNATVINSNMTVYPFFEADIQLKNCLSVVALEHTMFSMTHNGTNAISKDQGGTKPNVLYSTDGFKWNELSTKTISLEPGSAIYLRGNNPTMFNKDEKNFTTFTMAGTVHLTGSVMSLIDDGKGVATEIPNDYCFIRLFEGCSGIKAISSAFLPASVLKPHCYDSMFKNCTTLESFPYYMLKASTLAKGCYANMFANCTALKAIPKGTLQYATKLAEQCYFQMFFGCTSLTSLDEDLLPATKLAYACYEGMFMSSGLTALPTKLLSKPTALEGRCYYGMFADCKGLIDVSNLELKASTCAAGCYREMFYNCVNLTDAPLLPATTLAVGCYCSMFYNCNSLTDCPNLSAAGMEAYCYAYMFTNCTSIVNPPELASTSLADNCYQAMFYGCSKLKNAPSLLATTLKPYCYAEMFSKCKVLTGTPTFPTAEVTLAEYCCESMFAGSNITGTPALTAKTAAKGCYRYMFSGCTEVTSIGEVSLTTLADYACFMMFVNITKKKIVEYNYKPSGDACFFHCPSLGSFDNPVTSMFQGNPAESGGYPAKAGYYYRVENLAP